MADPEVIDLTEERTTSTRTTPPPRPSQPRPQHDNTALLEETRPIGVDICVDMVDLAGDAGDNDEHRILDYEFDAKDFSPSRPVPVIITKQNNRKTDEFEESTAKSRGENEKEDAQIISNLADKSNLANKVREKDQRKEEDRAKATANTAIIQPNDRLTQPSQGLILSDDRPKKRSYQGEKIIRNHEASASKARKNDHCTSPLSHPDERQSHEDWPGNNNGEKRNSHSPPLLNGPPRKKIYSTVRAEDQCNDPNLARAQFPPHWQASHDNGPSSLNEKTPKELNIVSTNNTRNDSSKFERRTENEIDVIIIDETSDYGEHCCDTSVPDDSCDVIDVWDAVPSNDSDDVVIADDNCEGGSTEKNDNDRIKQGGSFHEDESHKGKDLVADKNDETTAGEKNEKHTSEEENGNAVNQGEVLNPEKSLEDVDEHDSVANDRADEAVGEDSCEQIPAESQGGGFPENSYGDAVALDQLNGEEASTIISPRSGLDIHKPSEEAATGKSAEKSCDNRVLKEKDDIIHGKDPSGDAVLDERGNTVIVDESDDEVIAVESGRKQENVSIVGEHDKSAEKQENVFNVDEKQDLEEDWPSLMKTKDSATLPERAFVIVIDSSDDEAKEDVSRETRFKPTMKMRKKKRNRSIGSTPDEQDQGGQKKRGRNGRNTFVFSHHRRNRTATESSTSETPSNSAGIPASGRPGSRKFQFDKNYCYQFSNEEALIMQERLFQEAADRIRSQGVAQFRVVSHYDSFRSPMFDAPVTNIATQHPNHWQWKDHYARLGLPHASELRLVKTQYRRLALQYHPDKSKAETSAQFQAVTEAYRVLMGR
jgi:hypothetical protein